MVVPAIAATGGTKQSCMCLNTKSDQFDRVGRLVSTTIKMPRLFDIRVPMGNAKYGLIHLLARHTNNMRKFMGTTNQASGPADEGYRTMQGMMERLELEQLQEIGYAFVGSKWMFSGKHGALPVTKKCRTARFRSQRSKKRAAAVPRRLIMSSGNAGLGKSFVVVAARRGLPHPKLVFLDLVADCGLFAGQVVLIE